MKEIETKILEFDEQALRDSLKASNAKYKGKFFLRRMVFFISNEGSNRDEFLRVRTDGKRTTMTWKLRSRKKGLSNTEEIETEVNDFSKTVEIISKIWNGKKPIYQENKVEKWNYKDVEIAILTWPLIPPYLEIEGKTEAAVRSTIKALNIKGKTSATPTLLQYSTDMAITEKTGATYVFNKNPIQMPMPVLICDLFLLAEAVWTCLRCHPLSCKVHR